MSVLDLARPPFKVVPEQSAAAAAADMVAAFAIVAGQSGRVRFCFEVVTDCLEIPPDLPLMQAGRRLAAAIDEDDSDDRNTYHTTIHFCEVMLGACFLSLLVDLDDAARLEIVVAALIHDFHHDGSGNGAVPFRLERKALDAAAPYLEEGDVAALQRRRLAAMVLATEMSRGAAFARACYAAQGSVLPLPPELRAAPELADLATDAVLALQALVLCEADVLPSVGLTVEHALALQDRLAAEWGTTLTREDKHRFVTADFPGFVVGGLFRPNVERLAEFLRQQS